MGIPVGDSASRLGLDGGQHGVCARHRAFQKLLARVACSSYKHHQLAQERGNGKDVRVRVAITPYWFFCRKEALEMRIAVYSLSDAYRASVVHQIDKQRHQQLLGTSVGHQSQGY